MPGAASKGTARRRIKPAQTEESQIYYGNEVDLQDAEFAQMNNEQDTSNIQNNNNGEEDDDDDADQDEYDD